MPHSSGYRLSLSDGSNWWITGDEDNAQWVDELAAIMELEKCPSNGSPELIFSRMIDEDNAGNRYETGRIDFSIKRGPSKPQINGPHDGVPGEPCEYRFKSTDFYGDDVCFWIKWGDTTTTGWTDYVTSGTEITVSHTWSTQGTFTVEAKAKNTEGAESEWGMELIAKIKSLARLKNDGLTQNTKEKT